MIFSNEILMRVIIVFLGIYGFWVAKRIRDHKIKNTPLICPVGFDCHTVVHSDYSRFFGIPVEVLGMLYYAFISLAYLGLILVPSIIPTYIVASLSILSLTAFLFSIYLIFTQIFILRKGCSWCIVSALLCFAIFILSGIYPYFLL